MIFLGLGILGIRRPLSYRHRPRLPGRSGRCL